MCKRLLLLATLLSSVLASARDKPENWLQVRCPHFVVVSNASEKQARRVADQFERMRAVFHKLFPRLQIDPSAPIIVLAIKDEKDFRILEPPEYLAKGQLKLGGLFLRGPDKNYVLMRLDAEGEHPYAVVYHEYTHLLLSKAEWMPLWMNEGLAEFYQNTDIHEKDVALGQASPENLELLRENRLLPLATLFTVDNSSPYYHEENKGSIFYGESWALTHYLEQQDFKDKTHRLADYGQLLAQNVDSVTAATRAFGDLKRLQETLALYVRQGSFEYFKMAGATEVDDTAFQVQPLTATQADAVRADFLVYNQRTADARVLLDHVLQEDPNNVAAQETMGFLEFRERHMAEARRWYALAVKQDSHSYLAHYYFAVMSMDEIATPSDAAQVESSLRTAIKLNSSYAPSYNALAACLLTQHRNLDEARMMALNAIELEPGNLSYRMNAANILLQMDRPKDAASVIRYALRLAKSPEETAMAENFLRHVEEYAQSLEQKRLAGEQTPEVEADSSVEIDASSAASEDPVPSRPHQFALGVLKNVHCGRSAMDLEVVSRGKTLALHARNYYKVQYSVLNVTLQGDLKPCTDLEGRSAKVEYVEYANQAAVLVAIEVHK